MSGHIGRSENTESRISFAPTGTGSYKVNFENGVYMGEIYCEVDGTWVFGPKLRGGYWEGWVMVEIARELERLNQREETRAKE